MIKEAIDLLEKQEPEDQVLAAEYIKTAAEIILSNQEKHIQ